MLRLFQKTTCCSSLRTCDVTITTVSCLLLRVQEKRGGAWGGGCFLLWFNNGSKRPFAVVVLYVSKNLFAFLQAHRFVSHFYRLKVQCVLQGAVGGRPVPLLHKGKALPALRRGRLMRFPVIHQSLSFAFFQFLKQNNGRPVPCSFQWPWCVYIYKLAKQSASFIESITLGAGLWRFSYLCNWCRCIRPKSTYSLHPRVEVCMCLYCYFVYLCLSALEDWLTLQCFEFKPLFISLPPFGT